MSASVEFVVLTPEFWDEISALGKEVASSTLKLVATDAWGKTRATAPVDHGRLAGSWAINKVSDEEWRLSTNFDYAAAVSEGSRPHEIRARSGGVLAFKVSGQTVFARRVQHPGTRANPYVERAIEEATNQIDAHIGRALQEAT